MELTFESIRPVDNGVVKRRIQKSEFYSRLILFIELKRNGTGGGISITCNEVREFFQLDHAYVHRCLQFLSENGVLKKHARSSKNVFYLPVPDEVKKYVSIAKDKIGLGGAKT